MLETSIRKTKELGKQLHTKATELRLQNHTGFILLSQLIFCLWAKGIESSAGFPQNTGALVTAPREQGYGRVQEQHTDTEFQGFTSVLYTHTNPLFLT